MAIPSVPCSCPRDLRTNKPNVEGVSDALGGASRIKMLGPTDDWVPGEVYG